MKPSKILLLLLLSLSSFSAFADSATNNLKSCMTDNTTGRDRKDVARWIFIAMAGHSEMKDVSKTTPEVRDAINKKMGTLVTRLLTEQCAAQVRAASAESTGFPGAMSSSFETLGAVAVKELMSDPDVTTASQDFLKYVDKQKFEALLRAK